MLHVGEELSVCRSWIPRENSSTTAQITSLLLLMLWQDDDRLLLQKAPFRSQLWNSVVVQFIFS